MPTCSFTGCEVREGVVGRDVRSRAMFPPHDNYPTGDPPNYNYVTKHQCPTTLPRGGSGEICALP